MGKLFPAIMPEHEAFIRKQRLFFVGTAPLAESGHINISPKGYDTLRILSSNEVAYLDVTGSGNETSAHIAENTRVTFMFVAFEGPPQIVRLFGTGSVVLPGTPRWDELIGRFERIPGMRQIICANITEVKTSCGYSVPYFDYAGERNTLRNWAVTKGEQGLEDYRRQKNAVSMDGIVTPLGKQLSME